MGRSENVEELWNNVSLALKMLKIDIAALYLNNPGKGDKQQMKPEIPDGQNIEERRKTSLLLSSVSLRKNPPDWVWHREPLIQDNNNCSRSLLRLEMQLISANKANFGTLLVLKDLNRDSMNNYTLKRVESLRRSVISALENIEKKEKFKAKGEGRRPQSARCKA